MRTNIKRDFLCLLAFLFVFLGVCFVCFCVYVCLFPLWGSLNNFGPWGLKVVHFLRRVAVLLQPTVCIKDGVYRAGLCLPNHYQVLCDDPLWSGWLTYGLVPWPFFPEKIDCIFGLVCHNESDWFSSVEIKTPAKLMLGQVPSVCLFLYNLVFFQVRTLLHPFESSPIPRAQIKRTKEGLRFVDQLFCFNWGFQ